MKRGILVLVVALSVSMMFVSGAWASDTMMVEAATFNVVPSGKMGSAFMVVTNQGNEDDRLVSCSVREIPSARCEVHNVEDGKMFQVEGVDIDAGETLLLKKGSYHIMVMDMEQAPAGDVTLVLNFSKAGAVETPAMLKMTGGGMGDMTRSGH